MRILGDLAYFPCRPLAGLLALLRSMGCGGWPLTSASHAGFQGRGLGAVARALRSWTLEAGARRARPIPSCGRTAPCNEPRMTLAGNYPKLCWWRAALHCLRAWASKELSPSSRISIPLKQS